MRYTIDDRCKKAGPQTVAEFVGSIYHILMTSTSIRATYEMTFMGHRLRATFRRNKKTPTFIVEDAE